MDHALTATAASLLTLAAVWLGHHLARPEQKRHRLPSSPGGIYTPPATSDQPTPATDPTPWTSQPTPEPEPNPLPDRDLPDYVA